MIYPAKRRRISEPGKVRIALAIAVLRRRAVVSGTVQLDSQLFFGAEEVQNVGADTVLAPKLAARELAMLKR